MTDHKVYPSAHATFSYEMYWKRLFHTVCINPIDDAEFVGHVHLGNTANNITAGVYLSNEPWAAKPVDKDDVTFHVMIEDCTPVVLGMEGKNPNGGNSVAAFVVGDYEEHVDNHSVFEVPNICM